MSLQTDGAARVPAAEAHGVLQINIEGSVIVPPPSGTDAEVVRTLAD